MRPPSQQSAYRRTPAHLLGIAAILLLLPSTAEALEKPAKEKERLKACEAQLCNLLVTRQPTKGQLKCDIGKKWGESDIKKGADKKDIGWSFGDARCNLVVRAKRSSLIKAVTAPKYKLAFSRHTVHCDVETSSGVEPLVVKFAPRIHFKDGKAEKVWIKLKSVKGPSLLSSLVWTVAKLNDGVGLFHSDMLKEINKFIHKKCPKVHKAQAKKEPKNKEVAKKAKKSKPTTDGSEE